MRYFVRMFILFCFMSLVMSNPKSHKDKLRIRKDKISVNAQELRTFRKDNLDCHNNYRSKHHSPKLRPSKQLDLYAQSFAEELAKRDVLEHSGGPYGENLYISTGQVSGDMPCNVWYSERKHYDFEEPSPTSLHQTSHFTQMIWKSTERVGFGYALTTNGNTVVVATYDPPGNFKNHYKLNVRPKSKGK